MNALDMAITLTQTTCGLNCWYAREEICRCSCDGSNHGCMKVEGAAQPIRETRRQGKVYRLAVVNDYVGTHRAATFMAKSLPSTFRFGNYESWSVGSWADCATKREWVARNGDFQAAPHVVVAAASKAQCKWAEVKAVMDSRPMFARRGWTPHLAWVRDEHYDAAVTALEAADLKEVD